MTAFVRAQSPGTETKDQKQKPPEPAAPSWHARLRGCVVAACPVAVKTGLWLLKITVPLSFLVMVMKVTGILGVVARLCRPLFGLLGLPGEAAIVFVTSCLTNIYSCIAVIQTLGLNGRTVTILALMCLISHNLVVECAVQKKTGSRLTRMLLLRLGMSFIAGLTLNWLLPPDAWQAPTSSSYHGITVAAFGLEFRKWLAGMCVLCTKIMVLVTLLMILERILQEFGITRLLSRFMKYPLLLLGLPSDTAFLWIVANVLGLAYGAGVMMDNVGRGLISQSDADTLNHHVAVSHSLLEDTCLFAAIGVSVWWILVPRIVLAGVVVWLKRLSDRVVHAPAGGHPQ